MNYLYFLSNPPNLSKKEIIIHNNSDLDIFNLFASEIANDKNFSSILLYSSSNSEKKDVIFFANPIDPLNLSDNPSNDKLIISLSNNNLSAKIHFKDPFFNSKKPFTEMSSIIIPPFVSLIWSGDDSSISFSISNTSPFNLLIPSICALGNKSQNLSKSNNSFTNLFISSIQHNPSPNNINKCDNLSANQSTNQSANQPDLNQKIIENFSFGNDNNNLQHFNNISIIILLLFVIAVYIYLNYY